MLVLLEKITTKKNAPPLEREGIQANKGFQTFPSLERAAKSCAQSMYINTNTQAGRHGALLLSLGEIEVTLPAADAIELYRVLAWHPPASDGMTLRPATAIAPRAKTFPVRIAVFSSETSIAPADQWPSVEFTADAIVAAAIGSRILGENALGILSAIAFAEGDWFREVVLHGEKEQNHIAIRARPTTQGVA